MDVLGEIFNVSDEGSLGIDVFRQVAELDTAMRVVMSSLPVDEAVIGDAMLALGAIAAGPVRLGAEVLKSTLVGDYIDDASRAAKDYVSTAMAGAAHNADRESMAHVAGAEAGLYEALFDLTESLEGPVSSYSEEDRALYDSLNQSIALSEGIGDTLHGAQIVTDYVYAVMMGAGGGVAKSSRRDDGIEADQRDPNAQTIEPDPGGQVANSVDIEKPYKRPSGATNKQMRESVQGKPCVKCGDLTGKQVAGHKKALVEEYYETGSIDKKRMRSLDAIQPECPTCSAKEGADMARYSRQKKKELGLK